MNSNPKNGWHDRKKELSCSLYSRDHYFRKISHTFYFFFKTWVPKIFDEIIYEPIEANRIYFPLVNY